MSYHDILVKVGDFGLYQKLLCGIFVFYTTFLCGLNFYTQVFIFNTPAHRCSDDVIDFEQGRAGASWEEVLPWVPRETGYPSSCHMLDASSIEAKFRNLSTTYFSSLKMQDTDPDQFTAIRHNVISLVEGSPHKLCDQGWNFDHRNVFNTITSENNWVCEEDYKPMLIHTIFWIGNTVGCLLWGFTNDFFGRKPTVLLTHTVYVLAGAATLMAPNFTALLICSCRVLRGVKPDGAPADGDDELHPRLPHPPLGGHAHALLEASLPYGCPGNSSHPRWMEVDSGVAKLAAGEGPD